MKGGRKIEKVTNIIDNIDNINDFRFGKMSEKDFESMTKKDLFSTGIKWRIFLFHIARPFEYPIADQNVFRTFKTHKKVNEPKDFKEYKLYKDYFFEVSKYAGVITGEPTGDESNIKDIVAKLKEVDNALFAFGKFLKTYGDRNEPKNRSDLLRRE
jgi:hypothetical protein